LLDIERPLIPFLDLEVGKDSVPTFDQPLGIIR